MEENPYESPKVPSDDCDLASSNRKPWTMEQRAWAALIVYSLTMLSWYGWRWFFF